MGCEKSFMAVTVAIAMEILCLSATPSLVRAQGGDVQSCATSLIPCANFINSTNPPPSCCNPLKEAIKNQMPCLCNIFNDPGLLQQFKINVTDALLLPQRCHISGVSTNMCSPSPPTSAPTASRSSSGSSTTPSTPTQGENAADSVAWSRVSFLFVSLSLLMLY